jgi:2-keto-3-deoxy-L-rhamnonate aldolase RhmA
MTYSPGSRRLLEGLKDQRKLLGCWSSLSGAWIARILAKCDYDVGQNRVFLDTLVD